MLSHIKNAKCNSKKIHLKEEKLRLQELVRENARSTKKREDASTGVLTSILGATQSIIISIFKPFIAKKSLTEIKDLESGDAHRTSQVRCF